MSSTTYGINLTSLFTSLDGFDVTSCFPFDIMHTVFEGVAKRHLGLLLHHIIDVKQYCNLNDVNHALSVHPYGYSESDTRPTLIKRESSSSNFHITESGITTSKIHHVCT